MDDGQIIKHESFATLGISRVSSNKDTALFGSSIKHKNMINMRITPAKLERHLNKDWIYTDGLPYIEIEMSSTQFAEAITSFNMGEGIPVTLTMLNGKEIEACPFLDKRQMFEQEFKNDMKDLEIRLSKLIKQAEELLKDKKPSTKKQKEQILDGIQMLRQEVRSNIPFIQSSFNEQMDKTVLEAKGEIEGFINKKIVDAGLEHLQNEANFKSLGE